MNAPIGTPGVRALAPLDRRIVAATQAGLPLTSRPYLSRGPLVPALPAGCRSLEPARDEVRGFFEVAPFNARNMIVGFCRFAGHSVGIVANQPYHLAGVLDIKASNKAATRLSTKIDPRQVSIVAFVRNPRTLEVLQAVHVDASVVKKKAGAPK